MKKSLDILLSLKNISKSFNESGSKLTVLNNLSIDINRGEFVSILGPSGCGKSTLLKICSSLIKQDSGEVRVSNVVVNHPERNRILMLQDDNQLFPWLTVEKNVAFSAKGTDLDRKESDLSNLLDMSGLSDYSKYYPHQLSGGMKKRTALARALAGDPEILFMDEPFGSLDPKIKKKLQDFLLEIWVKYKMTVLFVTHDIHEAIHLGGRIIVLNNTGNIISDEVIMISKDSSSSRGGYFELYKKYYTLMTDLEVD